MEKVLTTTFATVILAAGLMAFPSNSSQAVSVSAGVSNASIGVHVISASGGVL